MCIIIDANVGNEFGPLSDEVLCVYEWLVGGGRVAVGGRLKAELLRTKFRNVYQPLLLAGRLLEYPATEVNQVEQQLVQSGKMRSDDHHILALARVSEARTLFSRDVQLHSDFCNR